MLRVLSIVGNRLTPHALDRMATVLDDDSVAPHMEAFYARPVTLRTSDAPPSWLETFKRRNIYCDGWL